MESKKHATIIIINLNLDKIPKLLPFYTNKVP